MRKAELAVDKKQDELARAAIERAVGYGKLAEDFAEEIAHQKSQVENLKSALEKLERKLGEAQAKSDLLLAQHRRSRALNRASQARMAVTDQSKMATFDRMKSKVQGEDVLSQTLSEMAGFEDKLGALDHDDEINRLLAEIKNRRGIA
jgi:phage shock protein A